MDTVYGLLKSAAPIKVPKYTKEQLQAVKDEAAKGGDTGMTVGSLGGSLLGAAVGLPMALRAKSPAAERAWLIGAPLLGGLGGMFGGREIERSFFPPDKTASAIGSRVVEKLAASDDWVRAYEEAGWHVPKLTRKMEAFDAHPAVHMGIPAAGMGVAGGLLGSVAKVPSKWRIPAIAGGALAGAGVGAGLGAGANRLGEMLSRYTAKKMLADPVRMRGLGWKRKDELEPGEDPWI